jgi:hypothetical protein
LEITRGSDCSLFYGVKQYQKFSVGTKEKLGRSVKMAEVRVQNKSWERKHLIVINSNELAPIQVWRITDFPETK